MPLIPVLEQKTIHDLLLVLDLAGTFVFAISGAMLGVRRNLDIFGILVLSFAASSAGGIARDLLIAFLQCNVNAAGFRRLHSFRWSPDSPGPLPTA